jgi:hypothetical protein
MEEKPTGMIARTSQEPLLWLEPLYDLVDRFRMSREPGAIGRSIGQTSLNRAYAPFQPVTNSPRLGSDARRSRSISNPQKGYRCLVNLQLFADSVPTDSCCGLSRVHS